MVHIWNLVLDEVSKKIPKIYYEPFISPLSYIDSDEEKIFLRAPSGAIKDHVERKYQKDIEEAASRVKGSPLRVEISIDSESSNIANVIIDRFKDEPGTNPDFVFSNFIESDSNRLAISACKEILLSPGSMNPLYIFGKVGTGKTHILQALTSEWKETHPNHLVKYVSIASFMNEFVYNVSNRQSMDAFKQKYQSYHLLVVDDIQSLNSSAEKTQEEFYNLFNYLFDRKRQIVIAADKPVSALTLTEKLKSRFVNGTQVEIQNPDSVLKIKLIYNKSQELGINLSPASVQYLSENFSEDTRNLLGCLNDLSLYKRTFGLLLLSDEKIKEILEMRIKRIKTLDITHDRVIDKVCEVFAQEKLSVLGKSRKSEFILPRHASMYLLFEICKMSKTQIGRVFGAQHATVINAIKNVEELIKKDESFSLKLSTIRNSFRGK